MQPFMLLFSQPLVPMILCILIVLLFLLVFIQGVQIGRMKKRIKRFFTGNDGYDIEGNILRLFETMEEYKTKQDDQQFTINRLAQRIAQTAGNLAVIRYNAFGNTGSDLSFSLALLDEQQNGVVITSIYGREESRTYAKPVEGGKSVYNLSEEEMAAIKKASHPLKS